MGRATIDVLACDAGTSYPRAHAALLTDIASRHSGALSEQFVAQLCKRLRDQDPRTTPALDWLEERLGQQGCTAEEAVRKGVPALSSAQETWWGRW